MGNTYDKTRGAQPDGLHNGLCFI